MIGVSPILTCEEAHTFERQLLGEDINKIREAMSSVAKKLVHAILRDYSEIGPFPEKPSILVLVGKGHNAGDGILAAKDIKASHPNATIHLLFCLGKDGLRPLVEEALYHLETYTEVDLDQALATPYDLCIDGVLGMNFTPPVREPLLATLQSINAHEHIHFRAAVDIPSGLVFRADFTYATGIAKTPLFDTENLPLVGRVRFLDIGFFDNGYDTSHTTSEFLLTDNVLAPLRELRKVTTDKRDYGHLFILTGSTRYPGALMMSVKSALKAGLGLITVFAPESLIPAYAAEVPECMWVPWPEVHDSGYASLALSGLPLLAEKASRGDAILMGPGMGNHPETVQLIQHVLTEYTCPVVLDASALLPEVFEVAQNRPNVIATPHFGEFQRIAGERSLYEWWNDTHITTLLKGPISKIIDNGIIYNSTYGGPVLARGGSGDILSGLVGALTALNPQDLLGALARATVWHGRAADLLAQSKGQVSTTTTELFDYLESVLRTPE